MSAGMALQAAQTGRSLRRAVLTFLVPEWSRSFATEGRSTIDFGYREVPLQEKEGLVAGVFSSVAGSYDVMNDLMSAGMHRVWKDSLVAELRPFAGMKHLDVAGGTGDVAFRVLAAVQAAEASGGGAAAAAAAAAAPQPQSRAGHVTVCDINPAMLAVGRRRAAERGLDAGGQLSWVEGNAEALPIPSGSQDAYTVAFGLRNMTDRGAVLREALRVLRRGGRFLCLEFSQVRGAALRELYDAYSFSVIPRIGALVAGDADSYQYLVESIRQFPDQATLAAMIRDAGFKGVTYDNYSNGIVALHSGFKL